MKNTIVKGGICLGLLFGASQGCYDSSSEKIKSGETVVFNIYQEGASFTVMLDKADSDQIIKSRGSQMGPVDIVFPAGSLEGATSVTISKFDGIPEYLVSTSINESVTPVSTGSSIEIEPVYEQNPQKPITISLPAPSLATLNPAYPAVMYSKFDYDSDEYAMGLIKGNGINVGNGIFTFEVDYFGVFQPIYLSDGIMSVENKPEIKSQNDSGLVLGTTIIMCSEAPGDTMFAGLNNQNEATLKIEEGEHHEDLFGKNDLNLLTYED